MPVLSQAELEKRLYFTARLAAAIKDEATARKAVLSAPEPQEAQRTPVVVVSREIRGIETKR